MSARVFRFSEERACLKIQRQEGAWPVLISEYGSARQGTKGQSWAAGEGGSRTCRVLHKPGICSFKNCVVLLE